MSTGQLLRVKTFLKHRQMILGLYTLYEKYFFFRNTWLQLALQVDVIKFLRDVLNEVFKFY